MPTIPKQTECAELGCREPRIARSSFCQAHSTRKAQDRSKEAQVRSDLYQTRHWKSFRKGVLAISPFCVACKAQNRVKMATVIDHVFPVAQGGAFVTDDVQTLCLDHHSWKSALERRGVIVDWRSGVEVRTNLADYYPPGDNPGSIFRIF